MNSPRTNAASLKRGKSAKQKAAAWRDFVNFCSKRGVKITRDATGAYWRLWLVINQKAQAEL